MSAPTRMHRIYIGLGLIPLVLDSTLLDNGIPGIVMLALVAAGSVLLLAGIILHQRHSPGVADERFLLHRLKSSRFGLIAGLLAILALFFYHAMAGNEPPWDLVAVAAAMAVGKLAAMAYFKVTG
jgi:hypothetical protein